MWICFNDGLVSAVEHSKRKLKIRARRKEILERLFPDKRIITSYNSDYWYRVFCTREEFAKIVADNVANIDYRNFKDSVVDKDLKRLYNGFWSDHWNYQHAGYYRPLKDRIALDNWFITRGEPVE